MPAIELILPLSMSSQILRPPYQLSFKSAGTCEESTQCHYVFVRGQYRGIRCSNQAAPGTFFCVQDKGKVAAKTQLETLLFSRCFARFTGVRDLSSLRENELLTDVTLVASGVRFNAHKFMLVAASPYFERFFFSGFKRANDQITFNDVSSEIIQLYLDLIYGKEVLLTDWKIAFDLFDFFERTLISWEKDSAVTSMNVPPGQYFEYIQRMERLYGGEIPVSVIQATKKFVSGQVDLIGLSKEFIDVIISS